MIKKYAKLLLSIGAAVLTTLAMLPPPHIVYASFSASMQEYSVVKVVLACLLGVFYRKTLFRGGERLRVRVSTLVYSGVLSLCILIGLSYQAFASWILFRNAPLWCAVIFAGYTLFFYNAVTELFAFFERAGSGLKARALPKAIVFLLERRPFLIPFAVCLLAWLPCWLTLFPGTVLWDMQWQLFWYFGRYHITAHHPVLSTLLYGVIMDLGRTLLNDTLGLFLIVLFQQLSLAFVCAYAMKTFKAWGAAGWVRFLALVFFAAHPMIAFTVQTAAKDTISMSVMCLFCLLFIDLLRNIKLGLPVYRKLAAAVIAALIASLFRYNNIYVVVISFIVLIFAGQSLKRRLLCFCAALVCFLGVRLITNALNARYNAAPGSTMEYFSIPIQQTARYLRDYPDDVTPGERAAIDAVLEYGELAEIYDPEISDPVKNTSKRNDEALPEYFRAWLSMLFRHPGPYLQATLNNTYAYYSPAAESKSAVFVSWADQTTVLEYFYIDYSPHAIREAAYQVLLDFKELPVAGMLINQGSIVWILLLLVLWLYRKKSRATIIGFAPAFALLLTCIASPVNGDWRYFVPILIMLPLLFVWTVCAVFGEEALNKPLDELAPRPRQ